MALLPYLSTTWELRNVENFDNPTVRFVGCYFDDKPWYPTFIADDEWFLGWQREANPRVDEATMLKYENRISEIQPGDVLIMSNRGGPGATTVRAIGIVLYYRDLPVYENGFATDRTYRVFKMAWSNKSVNLQLTASGPFDRQGSVSKGYRLEELKFNIIPEWENKDDAVADSFKALLKEIAKARMRFLRLNLSNMQPKNY